MQNKLRIIGGQWRSRHISFSDAPGLRPTPARVRETVFNWLQYDIVGKQCLDLYAGSGALGFEAASRGAKAVVQVENNLHVYQALQHNVTALAAQHIKIVHKDVQLFLRESHDYFDIVFIDPPFHKNFVPATCQALETNAWLNSQAKIYIETERALTLEGLPENWQLLKHKTAGDVTYRLFERQ